MLWRRHVGAQIKKFNTQAQIAQPKFLIGKPQPQIAQEKIKSEKRKHKLRKKIKSVNHKRKLRNFFQAFTKAQAQIVQTLKKWIKRKAQIE